MLRVRRIQFPANCLVTVPIAAYQLTAYLPKEYQDEQSSESGDAAKKTSDLNPDADIASFYWSLSVPVDRLPKNGPKGLSDKLQFCLDQIHEWDPKL